MATNHISWDEVKKLIGSLKKDNNRLYLFCHIQTCLGLRASDVLSLRWSDFDKKELIIIERKTKKERVLLINDSLKEEINSEFRQKVLRNKKELIFLNRNKDKAISLSYINRELKKAFKKYNIESKQVSTHVFRKTFSYKILEENDFSDKAIFLVSRLLNHSNINTTMRYLQLDKKEETMAYQNLII